MLQVTELVREFRSADAQAYLDTYPFAQYQFQTAFPFLYTPDLTFKSIEATAGAKVAADVVAFNSRAPRKGRDLPGTAMGAIPKVEMAKEKSEDEMNIFRGLQTALTSTSVVGGRDQISNQIVEWIYGDGAAVADGVQSRLEWLAKQITSKGKLSLTIANNEGGIQTKYDVDFGIPNANKVSAATIWSDPNADPVKDIENRTKAGRTKGVVFRYMFMDRETFELLAANAKFQAFSASFAVNALNIQQRPDLATANAALSRQGLPQIVIWDSYVALEGKDGVKTVDSGWDAGAVTFSASNVLGNTQHTMSADEFVTVGKATKTKSGIVLVKTWAEEDPITVITKGTAYAIPVLNGAKNIHILKTAS